MASVGILLLPPVGVPVAYQWRTHISVVRYTFTIMSGHARGRSFKSKGITRPWQKNPAHQIVLPGQTTVVSVFLCDCYETNYYAVGMTHAEL